MSFESLFRDTDPVEELDDKFLHSYSYGRATIAFLEEVPEDTDEEGLDPLGIASDDESEAEWERLIREAEEQESRDTENKAALEEKRRLRREYQKNYRKGLIPPRRAKAIVRGRGKKETRKKLVYYLQPEVAMSLRDIVQSLGVTRRDYIQSVLESFLATKPSVKSLLPAHTGDDLLFFYDEIPETLWNKVAAMCRSKDGTRVANYYQVVESALGKAFADV